MEHQLQPRRDDPRNQAPAIGGHLFTEHPGWGLVDVYAAMIPEYPYRPAVHVHYRETVLRIRDGLPKMKEVPTDMGGSGVTLPE